MSEEMSYEEYEKKADEIREKNNEYLDGFEEHLKAKGLNAKTIDRHLFNVDFYINNYLLYYDIEDVTQGCYGVSGFLGSWFIRKAMWSSVNSIKSNIASLKKFYRYLLDQGVVTKEAYESLCEDMKDNKEEWFDMVRGYYDLDDDDLDMLI